MSIGHIRKHLVATAGALSVAACGGGGGGGVAAVPPPPAAPPPHPVEAAATSLPIIDNAPSGDLAVDGAVFSAEGRTFDPADLPRFRYDAATDTYQINSQSAGWQTLYSPNPENTVPNRTQAWTDGGPTLTLGRERTLINGDTEWSHPYAFSTLVSYVGADSIGWLALGVPTPASGLPTTGSASFSGVIIGSADILVDDGYDVLEPVDVGGSVSLELDFGTSRLTGSIQPTIVTDYLGHTESLGVFTFKNAVYSAGAFSGQFDSAAAGLNGFQGRLTGPHGGELIGGWALPFHYHGDDQDHEAVGAWVAKQQP